jgi:hypothetical protein
MDPRGEKIALISSVLHGVTGHLGFDGLRVDPTGRTTWVIICSEESSVSVRRGWWDNLVESNLVTVGEYIGEGAQRALEITQMGKDWIKR